MNPTVLIVYQSTDGHTATIAHRIAATLGERGIAATVATADDAPPPAGFDAVVVGDSIHAHRHSRSLTRYVTTNRAQLRDGPVALFQVSLTSASEDESAVDRATAWLDEFCSTTGLEPDLVALFAGALAYTRYRGLTRWMMRRVAAKEGLDTDTSTDHVYTDWDAVDAFATGVARAARRGASGPPVEPLVDADPAVVAPTASLREVVAALVAHDAGIVLVRTDDVDPLCTESMGGVLGVVSERDIIDAIHDGADLETQWAADVMTTDLVTLPPSSGTDDLAAAMRDRHIRHVLIPRGGGRTGVVSMRSLIGRQPDDGRAPG